MNARQLWRFDNSFVSKGNKVKQWLVDDDRIIFVMQMICILWKVRFDLTKCRHVNEWMISATALHTNTFHDRNIWKLQSKCTWLKTSRRTRTSHFSSVIPHSLVKRGYFSIHLSTARASIVDCGTALWHARLPRFRSELQRCIAFIITTSALLRTYQQRGRVNIFYRTVLLLPLSNNQTNNLRQELSYIYIKKSVCVT